MLDSPAQVLIAQHGHELLSLGLGVAGVVSLCAKPAERPPLAAGEAARALNTGALDGLRGLAALHIVSYHYARSRWSRMDLTPLGLPNGMDLLGEGTVSFFYLLSGFVLAVNYVGSLDVPVFLVRRLARLLPMYYFANAFSLCVYNANIAVCDYMRATDGVTLAQCTPRWPRRWDAQQVIDVFLTRDCFTTQGPDENSWGRPMQADFAPPPAADSAGSIVFAPPGSAVQCAWGLWTLFLRYFAIGGLVPDNAALPNEPSWTISIFVLMYFTYPIISRWLEGVKPHRTHARTARTRALRLQPGLRCCCSLACAAHRPRLTRPPSLRGSRAYTLLLLAFYAALLRLLYKNTTFGGFGAAYNWFPPQLPLFVVGALAALERTDAVAASRSGQPKFVTPLTGLADASLVLCVLTIASFVVWEHQFTAGFVTGADGVPNVDVPEIWAVRMLSFAILPVIFCNVAARRARRSRRRSAEA